MIVTLLEATICTSTILSPLCCGKHAIKHIAAVWKIGELQESLRHSAVASTSTNGERARNGTAGVKRVGKSGGGQKEGLGRSDPGMRQNRQPPNMLHSILLPRVRIASLRLAPYFPGVGPNRSIGTRGQMSPYLEEISSLFNPSMLAPLHPNWLGLGCKFKKHA